MQQNPYQSAINQLEAQISETKRLLADPDMALLAQEELGSLEQQLEELQTQAAALDSATAETADFSSEQPKGNCTLELRGGAGGDEAKNWAGELLRMYSRFAETNRLRIEYIDDLVVKFSGSVTLGGQQLSAYEVFQYESGVHRVQRVPTTEAAGRIHTSTASIAVLPEIPAHVITIREEDLEWHFMRAGGAGGQNVNKTNSAVRLIHQPSGLVVNCRTEKQQSQNRAIALQMLRAQLWEIQEEERLKKLGNARLLIGRAQRAEKIRTFNFPQNRVTDHRTKQSWYSLETIIEGEISGMLLEVRTALLEPESTSPALPEDHQQDQPDDVD
jgi:peptide chain release factor 1